MEQNQTSEYNLACGAGQLAFWDLEVFRTSRISEPQGTSRGQITGDQRLAPHANGSFRTDC